ncbi:MAG: hypothetical protein MMC33_000149 [Icmadophila ericetorum]|nr:hypothetical protein [Icmadophila ericetorum]
MAVDVRNALDLDSFLLNSGQESTHITTENKDQAEHIKGRLPNNWETDYDITTISITSGFELAIRKIDRKWMSVIKVWEENRVAAQREFERVFEDEKLRESLKQELDKFSEGCK